jgi:uncharacterized protein YecE (DUF72 family)
MLRIGTAGWAIRREHRDSFPGDGPQLSRYAARLNAAEINSSFYRPHRAATYARWAEETPGGFSFSVKMPRTITHEARLESAPGELARFLGESGALGEKLGCILIQLPPSLACRSSDFFSRFRDAYGGAAALEPRHASWFTTEVDAMLAQHRIARVVADPAIGSFAPGGFRGFEYWRLHGSPKIYHSNYDSAFLAGLAKRLGSDAWVIFDNTALGHAAANALELTRAVG